MRLTICVVLLSSLVFAQNAAQTQAAQDRARHAVQSEQQAGQAAALFNSSVTPGPKFSPKPGTFHGSIPPVSITVNAKDAVIYFTTDGSKPTPKSQRYTGPVSLSGTTTLKAIAIAPNLTQSWTVAGKYVVK